MRGFHTAALVALVALALCAGGAADTNTPQTRGAGASNIGTAGARPSLNITTTAERPQGSDADEFTRGRRPSRDGNRKKPYRGKPHGNEYKPFEPHPPVTPSPSHSQHCDNVVVACSHHSDCLSRFPCKFATCEPNHEKKKNTKKKKKVRWGRSDEDDEKDQPEEYERQSNQGTCVCGGNKPGPCLFPEGFPDDCTSIRTDVGICSNGICKAEPRDEGCPCGGVGDSCITDAINLNCLYADQKCKCDGNTENPDCVPNFLSTGTICSESENGCTVGKCDSSGACVVVDAVDGTPCNEANCALNSDADCLINSPTQCICESGSCAPNYLPAGTSCASDPGPCEVSTCSALGKCVLVDVSIGTGCFEGNPLCITAGKCAYGTDLTTSSLVCETFGCDPPFNPLCTSLGDPCIENGKSGTVETCCPTSGGGLDCTDAGPPITATCPCYGMGSCYFSGSDTGFCCPLSTGGDYECLANEDACKAKNPCANKDIGESCGTDRICCVDLSSVTQNNFNIECQEVDFCPCGVCTITDSSDEPNFGTVDAICAPNAGESLAECQDSCETCQFGTEDTPPFPPESCANANGGSCFSFVPNVPSVNQLCPKTQICIACKTSDNSGQCSAESDS